MPQALHFSRKLFRTAKGPIPEGAVERSETGGVCSRRAREQQLFPVWKTACFPAFSTQKNGSGPVLKTCGRFIPDWRKINRRSGTVCRMQRKSFDFLFYKRQNACIFIQNFPESGCLNYGAYRADPFCCGKPGGKSGKPHGKLALFFTKTVENPVEKVKSSFQTGNSIHFPVVLLCRKIRLTAVFLGGRCSGFPHWGIALNAPANHGTITAEKCGKTHRYRNTMRWRHPI